MDRLGWPYQEIDLRKAARNQYLGRFMLRAVARLDTALRARPVAATPADQAAAELDAALFAQDSGPRK